MRHACGPMQRFEYLNSYKAAPRGSLRGEPLWANQQATCRGPTSDRTKACVADCGRLNAGVWRHLLAYDDKEQSRRIVRAMPVCVKVRAVVTLTLTLSISTNKCCAWHTSLNMAKFKSGCIRCSKAIAGAVHRMACVQWFVHTGNVRLANFPLDRSSDITAVAYISEAARAYLRMLRAWTLQQPCKKGRTLQQPGWAL
eukprot:349651-Chlamydomonas_euryale.AAC.7